MLDPTRWIPPLAYLVAVAVYARQMLSEPSRARPGWGRWGIAATGAHLVQIAALAVERGRFPYASMWEALSVAVAAFSLSYLVLERLARSDALGAPFFGLAALGTLASASHPEAVRLPEHIQSGCFLIHVSLGVSGLALLTTSGLLSGAWLLQYRQLRSRRFTPLSRRAPDLATLDRLSLVSSTLGTALLAVSAILGAVWTVQWQVPVSNVTSKVATVVLAVLWNIGIAGIRRRERFSSRTTAWLSLAGIVPVLLVLWAGTRGL